MSNTLAPQPASVQHAAHTPDAGPTRVLDDHTVSRNPVRIVGGLAMLATSPLFLAAGLTSPPQRSKSDADYVASLAVDPARTALSADLYHYAWVAMVFGAIAALGLAAHGRGRVFTAIGCLVTVFGAVQLSGLLLSDFYNSANAKVAGVDQAVAAFKEVQSGASVGVWGLTALAAVLGMPLILAGLARAGRMPWWLLPMSVAGSAVPFFVTGTAGILLSSIGFVPGIWLAVLLLRPARAASAPASR